MGTDKDGNTQNPRRLLTFEEVLSEDFLVNLIDRYCDVPSGETVRMLQSNIRAEIRHFVLSGYPNAKISNRHVKDRAMAGMEAVALLRDLVFGMSKTAKALRQEGFSPNKEFYRREEEEGFSRKDFYSQLKILEAQLFSVAAQHSIKGDGRPATWRAAKPYILRIGQYYDRIHGKQYRNWDAAVVEAKNPTDGKEGYDLSREIAMNRAKFVSEIFGHIQKNGSRLRQSLPTELTFDEKKIREVLGYQFEPPLEDEEE